MKLSDNYKKGEHTKMIDEWELKYEIDKPYEQKLEETKEMIRVHLDNFKRPQVAFSGGKDSTVLASLITDICLNEKKMNPRTYHFPTFTLSHTRNIFPEEEKYWERIRLQLGIPKVKFLIFKAEKDDGTPETVWTVAKDVGHLPSFRIIGRKDIPYQFKHEPECCYRLKRKTTNRFLKKQSRKKRFDLVFVGIRAEESLARRTGVKMNCRTFDSRYHRPYISRTCWPLAFWTNEDIERYIKETGIEKCPSYKIHNIERMGCASCPAHKYWEKGLAEDPTGHGRGMLIMNLQILRVTQPNRFWNSMSRLFENHKDICDEVINSPELEEWRNKADYDEKLMKKARKVKEHYTKKQEGGVSRKSCLNGKCAADSFW